MSTPTKRSWPRLKAVETDADRKKRLENKLDSDKPLEIEDDEVTDVMELAQLKLRSSHDACTKAIREQIAEIADVAAETAATDGTRK